MSWAKRFPASSATGARAALTSRCNPCFAFRNDLNPSAAGGYRYTSFLFAPTQRDASGLRDGWSSRDGKHEEQQPMAPPHPRSRGTFPVNVSCTEPGCSHLPAGSSGAFCPPEL